MPGRSIAHLVVRAAVVLGLSGLAVAAAPAAHAGQGTGNPVLTVTPSSVGSGPTTVQVTGRDYLVPAYAQGQTVFGGVYVFFGYVEGSNWGPSNRTSTGTQGTFGGTYFYPGAGGGADTRNSNGSMAMVSFTPGGESGSQTQHHMDRNGNWTAPLNIPGPTFSTQLPNGQTRQFDCRTVTCGVFTIGAHGKTSATNEKFTPISFNGAAGGPVGAPQTFPQAQGFNAPPMGYPQQQPMMPPPQFAPPSQQYAPPPQFAAPPPQQQVAPPAAAPAAPTTAAPSPVATATPVSAPAASASEEEPSAGPVSLVPEQPAEQLEGRNVAAAGSFGEDADSGGGSVLLLTLAVAAGGGMAVAVIRMLAGGVGRGVGAGSPPSP